jgi:hypothetical protein
MNRVEGLINARRTITPLVFIGSIRENILRDFFGV